MNEDVNETVALLGAVGCFLKGYNSRRLISEAADQFRRLLGADSVAVFEKIGGSVPFDIVSAVGKVTANSFRRHISDLRYSPVRDIIEDGEEFSFKLVDSGKFAKLLSVFPFKYCSARLLEGKDEPRRCILFFYGDTAEAHIREADYLDLLKGLYSMKYSNIDREASDIAHAVEAQFRQTSSGVIPHEVVTRATFIRDVIVRLIKETIVIESDSRLPPDIVADIQSIRDSLENIHMIIHEINTTLDELMKLSSASDDMSLLLYRDTGTDLNTELQRLHRLATVIAEDENFVFDLDLDHHMPDEVHTSQALVKHIVLNLIYNALHQYRKRHGTSEGLRIEVSTRYETQHELPVKLTIQDNGPGIRRDVLGKVFQRGFTERTGGHGLGLYFSQQLVEYLGGSITVDSQGLDKGTVFIIRLPLHMERQSTMGERLEKLSSN